MAPLIVLIAVFVVSVWPLGWWTALRLALCAMFLLTASAHWGRRRPDLIRMVPAGIPNAGAMVTVTGICEILGAIGLLIPAVAPYAAIGLTLLLLAIFPANVRAAREQLSIAGTPAMPIVARTLVQIVFLTATIGVVAGAWLR